MTRRAARLAVLALGTLAALPLLAVAASAAPADDLPGHASRFSITEGFLVFGVAPVGVFLLIAAITMRPGSGSAKAQRYRPGREWNAQPSWSGLSPQAPQETPPALEAVPVMDGAPEHADADSADLVPGGGEPEAGRGRPRDTGGARGSW